jgi:hypothetical protein
MQLYLLSQTENTGYDTYDSCVVAADNEKEAKTMHPNGYDVIPFKDDYFSWTNDPDNVDCMKIGTATKEMKRGVICASYHAG